MSVQTYVWPRLDVLRRFVEFDATNLSLRKRAIEEALASRQWGVAQELIDAGLDLSPYDADLLAMRGFAHLQERRYVEAAENLASAIALGNESRKVKYNFAQARFAQKRYADALEVLTERICLNSHSASALRASCLEHLGCPEGT